MNFFKVASFSHSCHSNSSSLHLPVFLVTVFRFFTNKLAPCLLKHPVSRLLSQTFDLRLGTIPLLLLMDFWHRRNSLLSSTLMVPARKEQGGFLMIAPGQIFTVEKSFGLEVTQVSLTRCICYLLLVWPNFLSPDTPNSSYTIKIKGRDSSKAFSMVPGIQKLFTLKWVA